MLVLSRRANERILFPELNISVQVLATRSGQVRLGIQAPAGICVVREEVCNQHEATRCHRAHGPPDQLQHQANRC
jgi:carbon storage regulator CsrA